MNDKLSLYGAIAVSVVTLVLFGGALIVSFALHNETMESLTVGAAVANATTTVGYWLGSSSGSRKKDETIAAAAAGAPKP